MCVCMRAGVHTYVEPRGEHQVSYSVILHLIPSRHGSSLNLELDW